MMNELSVIEKLKTTQNAKRNELVFLLNNITENGREALRKAAQETSLRQFGNKIYIRGLIEISSYCKNDCYYCGLRRSNKNAVRYRLTEEQILSCCETGAALGFRTFVLQGGEDGHYTDELMCGIVRKIKDRYPDCAITLSLGERGEESFKKLFEAGADRYLLRHETADEAHYAKLHPESMSGAYRKELLYKLKEIGFQTGAGFMVGSPFQTTENLADDLLFIKRLAPQMCGIGPFIPHTDTRFVYPPHRHAFPRLGSGQPRTDSDAAFDNQADEPPCAAALDHRSRNDPPEGQRDGDFTRRERRYAQPLSCGAPQGLRDLRQ